MAVTKPAWKSPKAWTASTAMLIFAWVMVYLFTGSISKANATMAIFLIAGLAGFLIT